jgi:hypothetical protein
VAAPDELTARNSYLQIKAGSTGRATKETNPMQTLSLPHPGNVKRMTAVLVATAVLIAVLVVALINVTGGSGAGTGSPTIPVGHTHPVSPSSVSSTRCLYLDRPC